MRNILALSFLLAAGCATVEAPAPEVLPVTSAAVPIDPNDPARTILGRLRYLGGLHLQSTDKRFGGISSLKWREGSFHAVTDAGDWMRFDTAERSGKLEGVRVRAIGDLLDYEGAKLEGTPTGDAESLAFDGRDWLVGIERGHRIVRYPRLGDRALPSEHDPNALFGKLEDNGGIETLASRGGRTFICAERLPTAEAPNCFIHSRKGYEPVRIPPPFGRLDQRTAYPVDADWAADGTLYILIRSWSGGNDNRAAVMQRLPSGELRALATFTDHITRDNYEGLALREEGGRTFLYIVSDDNFGQYNEAGKPETWQRTLLLKFEIAR